MSETNTSVKQDIENGALLLIGAQEITDFNNTTDNKIKTLNNFYDVVKNKLLSLRSWTFAQKRAELEADKNEGAYVEHDDYFKYSFTLPADYIKLLTVSRHETLDSFYPDYEVRGNKIMAAVPVLYVKYTFSPNETDLPHTFRDLLKNALAAEICYKLTGDKNNQQVLYQKVWGSPSDNLKGGLFGFYAKADAAQNPSRQMKSSPMRFARWTGVQ